MSVQKAGVLALCLLLLGSGAGLKAQPQAGEIVSVEVEPEGWSALIGIQGMTGGGACRFGLGPRQTLTGAEALVFHVRSLGFDAAGQPTTVDRTVYGTSTIRRPYPRDEERDERLASGVLLLRIALSEPIYQKDRLGAGCSGRDVTLTANEGFYLEGGCHSRAAQGLRVVNGSTLAYPKVVGNWSTYPYQRVRGGTFTLRCVAFHGSARNGRPVAAVRFSASDTAGHTVSSLSAQPIIDASQPDPLKVIEYVATLSAGGLRQGDPLLMNFRAYPRVGDEAAVLDTALSPHIMPTPLPAPQPWLNDAEGSYGSAAAWVRASGGDDDAGVVIPASAFSPDLPPAPFATLAGAVNAILAYNELHHGRRDAGGAEVFLGAGTHVWTGGVVESHQPPQTLLTVTSFPGLQREEVILSGQTGSRSAGPRVRLCNLTLRPTGTCFSDMEVLVVEGCHVDTSAPTAFYEVQNSYWLHNRLSDAGEGALAFYSNLDTRPALIRGNTFDPGFEHPIFTYTVLGNRIYTVGGMWNEQWGQTIPHADPCVVAFNFVTATSRRVLGLYQGRAGTGAAVVQNIFERRESGYAPNVQVAADGSTEPVHNVLFWHNTLLGQRYNGAYNDLGEAPAPRFCWSLRNNAFDDYNIKADTFDPPHGARVGNWPVLYGTGCSGNAKVYVTGCGAWGFDDEFPGLSSLVDQNVPGTFLAYRYNRSYSGDGAGDGDYHPTGSSPLLGLALHQVLPFDLEGVPRRSGGASGAYEAGDAPQPRLELLAPNGSEIWRAGEERDLVWTAEGLTGNVVIELLQNGSPVGVVAASVPVSAQRFTWKVGALEDGRRLGGTGFCIRIRSGRQAGAVGKMWKEAGGGRRAEGS